MTGMYLLLNCYETTPVFDHGLIDLQIIQDLNRVF